MPDAPTHVVAVCSWSLRPHSPADLVRQVRATGLSAVQLALDPVARGLWKEDETFRLMRNSGIRVVSAMLAPAGEDYSTLDTIRATGGVRPESTWPANLKAAHQIADICARHSIPLCTFHAGHVPAAEPERAGMLDRLARMCRAFLARGVDVAFETGQEAAADQARILADLRALIGPDAGPINGAATGSRIGLNFDPANIILYGVGDPLDALEALKADVRQVHVKDATRAQTPGSWGAEVPVGMGDVPWSIFLASVHAAHPGIALVIEREAGDDRVADVVRARSLIQAVMGDAASIGAPPSAAPAVAADAAGPMPPAPESPAHG
jgi:sugar phosphate isomerase/epimerase